MASRAEQQIDGIMKCKVGLDGTWESVSHRFCKLLGYTEEELLDKTFVDITYPEDIDRDKEIIAGLEQGDIREFDYEKRYQHKNGDTIWASLAGALIRDEKGDPDYIVCYIYDLTEKKKAKKKLKETEQRFRSLFKHNPHPAYYFDLEGNFKEVNHKLVEFTGCPAEELLQMNFRDFIVDRDMQRTVENFEKAVSGELVQYEITVTVKGGEKKKISVTKFPMYLEDKVKGVFGVLQDLTEQKKAKRKLQRSEQRFKSLFESNPNAVYSFDDEGNFIVANESLEELTGYSNEELKEMNFGPIVIPEQREKVWNKYEKALQGEPQTYETSGVKKDGSRFDVQVTNLPIYIDGEIEGVFGIAQDITEEKQAKRRLEESEERWQRLVEENPQTVQIVQDGKIVFINQAGVELYGAESSKELIGIDVAELCHPDYRELLNQRKEKLEGDQKIEPGEIKMNTLDGRERFIETHSIPIKYKGESAIQTVVHDITERKEAEEALRRSEARLSRFFANLPGMAYCCKNTKGWPILFASQGSEELTGYKPQDFIDDSKKGINYGELIHEDDREYVWEQVQQAVDENVPFELNYRIYDREGNLHWVWERGLAIQGRDNSDGEVLVEGFISDISQQKIAEEKIRENLKEKKVLLQEIHHRVKNNLAVISGLLELQAMNIEDERTISTLRVSQLRIQSMAMIHEKLYQSEALSEIGIDHYIKELVNTIKNTYQFDQQQIGVEYNLDSVELNINQAIPCALILNELVVNAYKHAFVDMEAGTISIDLAAQNGELEITVSDDGIGLEENFDFEKQQTLGMTLVKTLSSQLDGELKINNSPSQKGASFSVQFEKV